MPTLKEAKADAKDAGVGIKASAAIARGDREREASVVTARVVRAARPQPDSRGEDRSGVEGTDHHRVEGMAQAEDGEMTARGNAARRRLGRKRRRCLSMSGFCRMKKASSRWPARSR